MSNETLDLFYETDFSHHEDLNDDVDDVARSPPFFDKKPVFADLKYNKFISKAEEMIYTQNECP